VALPTAEDVEPEMSDNELEEAYIEDDTEDDDDFLADFPDDTEVRTLAPERKTRNAVLGTLT
jgi:hypothetical protein